MDELREWLGEDFDPGDAALDEIDLEGLLGTYETAQRWVTVLPGNPRLAPRCADVVNQAQLVGVLPVLAPMFDAAGLDLSAEPPAAAGGGGAADPPRFSRKGEVRSASKSDTKK